GQFDKSIPVFEEIVEVRRVKFGRDDPQTLNDMANLGVNYKDAGRLKEAIPLLEEVIQGTKKAPALGWVPHQLFDALFRADAATAPKHLAAVIPSLRADLGENHPTTLVAMNNRGYALARSRQFTEAEATLTETIERQVRAFGEGNMLLLQTRTNLGEL